MLAMQALGIREAAICAAGDSSGSDLVALEREPDLEGEAGLVGERRAARDRCSVSIMRWRTSASCASALRSISICIAGDADSN